MLPDSRHGVLLVLGFDISIVPTAPRGFSSVVYIKLSIFNHYIIVGLRICDRVAANATPCTNASWPFEGYGRKRLLPSFEGILCHRRLARSSNEENVLLRPTLR